jgi:hypothetical protein
MEVKDALSEAVLEVLDKDNYVEWSIRVQTYLMAQDLWDTVEATTEPPKQEDDEATFMAWSEKNSMALNVIQKSCRPDTLFEIREISSANVAWNTLAVKYNVPKKTSSGLSLSLSLSLSLYICIFLSKIHMHAYMLKQRRL